MSDDITKSIKVNSDGSLHESKQGPTSSDGGWGRVSSNHHENGAITDVHVTGKSSDGTKTIVDIPTKNENFGDVVRSMFGLKD